VSDTLPLFPLGTVLVPGQELPLHIFEPRYRQLVSDLLDLPEADRVFGIIAIREGHEVGVNAARSLHSVGTAARLGSAARYPDGRFDIATVGGRRFRLDAVVDTGRPYLTGSVTWLAEEEGDAAAALAPTLRERLEDYREALIIGGLLDPDDDEPLPDDPRELSYAPVTGMILDLADRQSLLECPDDTARLRAGLALLRREAALAEVLPSVPAGDLARTSVSLN